jgi:peptidyl-prolyl cis-trans isomerase D
MKQGEVSEGIRTGQGTAFITVTGTQEARVPPLEEVKARVREDVIKQKAIEAARQKAASVASQAGSGDLVAAAKAAGLEAKTTEMLARGAAIPEVGVSPAVEAAAFSLPVNGVSQPIVTDNGAVIVKVVTKQEVSPDELTKGKVTVRDELLNEARNRFYGAYMTKVRDRLNQEQRIRLNPQTLAQVVG